MKKITIFAFVLIITSCYQPNRKCKDFKTGKYKFEAFINGNLETTVFERQDSIQVERYKEEIDTSKIRWVNDCEFILTPLSPKSILDQYQIHIKILSTTDKTYTFEYNVVGETQKEQGVAEQIDL